jgi:hypothetical protein
MSQDTTDVKNEEATSPESSTGEKQSAENKGSVEESSKKKGLGDYSKNEWDDQPESASLDEDTSLKQEEPEKSADTTEVEKPQTEEKDIKGLEQAKQRLISELQQLRADKKAEKEKATADVSGDTFDYTSEEEKEKLNLEALLDRKLEEREARNSFYGAHPGFYKGQTGEEHKSMVEEYIKLRYNPDKLSTTALNDLRSMVHQKFFGNYEIEGKIRQVKAEERNKHLMNDMAASVSIKGQDSPNLPKPGRKRILPIRTGPDKWY